MDFGQALAVVKNGGRVTRGTWAAGAFLYLVPGSTFQVNRAPLLGIYPAGTEITLPPATLISGRATARACRGSLRRMPWPADLRPGIRRRSLL